MNKMKNASIMICVLMINFYSSSQLIISGIYNGKNQYILNPTTDLPTEYCIDSIHLNGVKLDLNTKTAAIEINLISMNYSFGDSIEIILFHKNNCSPHVLRHYCLPLRPHSPLIKLKSETAIQLISEKVPIDSLSIELYRWNKWITIGRFDSTLHFELAELLHSGKNSIRAVYVDSDGIKSPSNEIICDSKKSEVNFEYNKKDKILVFSRSTTYEIFDIQGNLIQIGTTDRIDLTNFKPKIIYLNYDNYNSRIKL